MVKSNIVFAEWKPVPDNPTPYQVELLWVPSRVRRGTGFWDPILGAWRWDLTQQNCNQTDYLANIPPLPKLRDGHE